MGFQHFLNTLFPVVIDYKEIGKKIIIIKHNRPGVIIKKGSKLRIRKDQAVVFIKDGQVVTVVNPGTYYIYPEVFESLLSVHSFNYSFRSEVEADLYYLNLADFNNVQWSNKNPVSLNDKVFSYVHVRAYGTYSFKIINPVQFMNEVFCNMRKYFTCNMILYISSFVANATEQSISESGMSIIDLIKNFKRLEIRILDKLKDTPKRLGIEIYNVNINNISIPAVIEQMIEDNMWKEIEKRYN